MQNASFVIGQKKRFLFAPSLSAIFNLFSMKPLLFCREADIIYWW
jgi:hypothetical protein